jgi:steroid delta-isomerase-like uncharacterized protein
MSDTNRHVVSRFFLDAIGQGRVEALDCLLAPLYIEHRDTREWGGGEIGPKAWFSAIREAFPDRLVVLEELDAEEDLVWCRWSLSATHRRAFMDFAASGRRLELAGLDVFRLQDGRIAERWSQEHGPGLHQQLQLNALAARADAARPAASSVGRPRVPVLV